MSTDYTPIGPVPSGIANGTVDSTSRQLARDMRGKAYGKDVRETIARMTEWHSIRTSASEVLAAQSAASAQAGLSNLQKGIKDITTEYSSLKPQALSAIAKANTATARSVEALNTANGIDAKATEALSKSTDADALSKSVQSQFNQVVIDGDSSVEAAQARVDASGHTNATLKERLDKEHNEVTAQLAQIVTDLKLTDGADCTAQIQAGLDKKGWVRIAKPGTYLISKSLKIDSNTFFDLYPGVELKLAKGASTYLLVNKDQINGNVNIHIKGGKWNVDQPNNPPTGPYPNQWPGHGIFFHKIKNLTFEDMFNTGSPKYCYLVVDCDGFIAKNIGFDNTSDGLHFNPPLNNAYLNNLWGHTDDDMVSFTLGDYAWYQVSNVGNFENVTIDNIVCNDVKNVIKLTGSGQDSAYLFKNFNISNIQGTVSRSVLIIFDDPGDPQGSQNLLNTRIENISLKGVKTTGGINPILNISPTSGGDILIEDISCSTNNQLVAIGGVVDKVTLKNIKTKSTNTTIAGTRAFLLQGTIGSFILDGCEIQRFGTAFRLEGSVSIINISNVNFDSETTSGSYFIQTIPSFLTHSFLLNSSTVKNSAYLLDVRVILKMKIVNCNFFNSTIPNGLIIADGANLRIEGSGNSFDTFMTPYLIGTGACSINDLSWKTSYSKVTPQLSDMFYNTVDQSGAANPFKIGNVIWDGTKYKNLY